MKTNRTIFFAIPYDSATKSLYERVGERLRHSYPNLCLAIGTNEIGPSEKYSHISTFKAQNVDLHKQFTIQIQKADIVVADLSNNNPNVHVELGIALLQNKNILRVTGRALKELGFDIQNLDVYKYDSEDDLFKKIHDYLKIFTSIKDLTISSEHGKLYWKEPTPIPLTAFDAERRVSPLAIHQSHAPDVMRDGAFKLEFEFKEVNQSDNWFGVFFRAAEHPLMASHLLYVRKNGSVEIALYPDLPPIVAQFKGPAILGRQTIAAEFENNYLEVRIGDAQF